MPTPKLMIAAGGTGGHIYPALAIAEAFLKKNSGAIIEFVGTQSGLENKIIPAKGFKVHHLSIGRLNSNVSFGERVKTLLSLPFAFLKSAHLVRAFKPDLVLGVGGHASGPLLLIAHFLGYRTAIWEPNAMPGLANRWLAQWVDDCWVVFAEAKGQLKGSPAHLHTAGMPVRAAIENATSIRPARPSNEPFRILVFGGSQGALALNNAVVEMVKETGLGGLDIVHQTGTSDFNRVRAAYGESQVDVRAYLHDMDLQYARADLVICRAGTGTLFELAACGKPAILIPLPTAADDHQRKNAESLVAKNAAIMILQKDLTGPLLRQKIEELKSDPARLQRMSEAVRTFHRPRAAEHLVSEFMERLKTDASG